MPTPPAVNCAVAMPRGWWLVRELVGRDLVGGQGDSAGALAAYEAGLTIREGLAKRDLANTQWQVDVAASCAKLGSLDSLPPISTRKEYLSRGREILLALRRSERFPASQD